MIKVLEELNLPGLDTVKLIIVRKDVPKENQSFQLEFDFDEDFK